MKTISKVNILGTVYTIYRKKVEEDEKLEECAAYEDYTTKKIVIGIDKFKLDDPDCVIRQNLRHEIIHAFMDESGLGDNVENRNVGVPETYVDWFAIQYPKIKKVFEELGIEE